MWNRKTIEYKTKFEFLKALKGIPLILYNPKNIHIIQSDNEYLILTIEWYEEKSSLWQSYNEFLTA